MEVEPVTGSGLAETSGAAEEEQVAEIFLEIYTMAFGTDMVFEFIEENEDEG
jgi:4-hydroxyphenylpyruvate dioxygenase-like putative hemolysin